MFPHGDEVCDAKTNKGNYLSYNYVLCSFCIRIFVFLICLINYDVPVSKHLTKLSQSYLMLQKITNYINVHRYYRIIPIKLWRIIIEFPNLYNFEKLESLNWNLIIKQWNAF